MSSKQRFIKSVVATAKADAPAMPWARGARRAAFIAKRSGVEMDKKAA
ncbi:hypothetical protein SAMN05444000_102157 [Shimia gijangensis]|uniref:Uncharacterized protein n=1 Tax=Shimia gijangensis TaxID=1470563 RepID=A0A1M6CUX5_9RHOB|nr:hypothetical protein [Shimia gijangensis]SHI64822.1 hypothetical protein SAMN05444000_102157 [Shimia gijangensis]